MHRTSDELEAGLEAIRQSPADEGTVDLIVRRPCAGERELPSRCQLDLEEGLIGDNWSVRGSSRTTDGSPHPDKQITLMNSRVAALVAIERDRLPLPGDQFLVDLDLSVENLPVGARIQIGGAILEVTDQLHRGCKKFAVRFGKEALLWVRSPRGMEMRLRGVNTRLVQPGEVKLGDTIRVERR